MESSGQHQSSLTPAISDHYRLLVGPYRVLRPWWAKVFFVVLVGGAQALSIVFFAALSIGGPQLFDNIRLSQADPAIGVILLMVFGGVVLLQAAIVTPTFAPRRRDIPAAWWRCAIGALSLTLLVGILSMLTFLILQGFVGIIIDVPPFGQGFPAFFSAMAGFFTFACSFWLLRRHENSLLATIVICASACAALFTGALFSVFSAVIHYKEDLLSSANESIFDTYAPFIAVAIIVIFFVTWAIGTVLIFHFKRGQNPDSYISKIASRIFVGTAIEAAAIIPLDVMIRRRSDCYCSDGTFWTLFACSTIGVVMFGPIVFLLPLGRRLRRLHHGRCRACGYEMSTLTTATRCPECGAGWKAPRHTT